MFYEFSQNNSGGSFDVDKKLCHRLFIEAENSEESVSIAESLGCYWDGVDNDMDCECCGDRWYASPSEIDIDKMKKGGYSVNVYDHFENPEEEWKNKYSAYPILNEPKWKTQYGTRSFVGRIYFNDIEQYAQFMADEFGWTTPDVRIFYSDGNITEIFSKKIARTKR